MYFDGIFMRMAKKLVDSMYNVLIQSDIPIDKKGNNKLWKLKTPLGSRYLDGTSGKE
jgi:hypothetical protein